MRCAWDRCPWTVITWPTSLLRPQGRRRPHAARPEAGGFAHKACSLATMTLQPWDGSRWGLSFGRVSMGRDHLADCPTATAGTGAAACQGTGGREPGPQGSLLSHHGIAMSRRQPMVGLDFGRVHGHGKPWPTSSLTHCSRGLLRVRRLQEPTGMAAGPDPAGGSRSLDHGAACPDATTARPGHRPLPSHPPAPAMAWSGSTS